MITENIVVFDPSGKQIGEIDVPERPIDPIFGDKERHVVYPDP